MNIDAFTLWELHSWQPCDVCGLRGEDLTEPFVLERHVGWTVGNEAVMVTEIVAPPMARFLRPDEAKEVFAAQLTTRKSYAEAIEVTSFSGNTRVIAGRRRRRP